jgi:hypothetical protein
MMRTTTLAFPICGALLGQLLFAPVLAADVQVLASTSVMLVQAEPAPQPQAPPTPQQRAAMLKQWLQASQQQVRAYEWIETTVVSKDGEQKSSTQKRCYYGVDGKVQKVVLQQSTEQQGGPPGILPLGRLAKKAAEHKKEEMTAYMHSAVDLVHSYIPPVPGLIQQAINGGRLGMQLLDPGRRVRLNFADYLKPGDSLGVDIELPTNRLLAMAVASYLDSPADAIALNVTMSVLPDGTIYAARSTLDAKAKGLNVTVENTGYRRIAP